MTFSSIGISRHRIGRDGVGVTTLVGGHGCPLSCKYCLNPQCKSRNALFSLSVSELYEKLRIDSLYFSATGGGVTFGGGEPLLQAEFIREFILYVREKGDDWRFSLETCLAVDLRSLKLLDGLIDEYIVDVKDMNPDIYRAYTGKSHDLMYRALEHLSPVSDKVTVRVPLIPDFNTVTDIEYSRAVLEAYGFENFDIFKYSTDIKKTRKREDLPQNAVDKSE